MRRIFTALMVGIFVFSLFSGCITGFASGEIITIDEPRLDPITETLNISGSVESNRGYIPMLLWVKLGNTTIEAQQIVTGDAIDGTVSYSFEPIPFNSSTLSGVYTIYISADFVGASAEIDYNYIGIDKRFDADKAIVDAKESVDDMQDVIMDYSDVFAIDIDIYNKLSDSAKENLAERLMEDDYICPENYTDEGNADIISENISNFVSNYNEYMIIVQAIDVEDEDSVDAWLKNYGIGAGFYLDNSETDYNEETIAKDYFDDIEKKSAFTKRISDIAKNAEDFDELKDEVLRATLLTFIETSNYAKTKQITEAFPELFDIFTSDFKKLSSYEKSEVYKEVTGTYWETIEAFNEGVKEAAENVKDGDSGSSGGGKGSSSGGGSKGTYGGNVEVSKDVVKENSNTNTFSDMADFEWAQKAVNSLSKKGIVSGREEGKFVPDGNVTRAEFIKMLVLATGIEPAEDYSGYFADVKKDDWFAPFVEAAKAAGIATGADGKFMPDENISREDMAVLLYRAYGFEASENERDVFIDSNLISDYAKSAVFALYEKGIILGNGNGEFNPKGNALRAEAAQIIYRSI